MTHPQPQWAPRPRLSLKPTVVALYQRVCPYTDKHNEVPPVWHCYARRSEELLQHQRVGVTASWHNGALIASMAVWGWPHRLCTTSVVATKKRGASVSFPSHAHPLLSAADVCSVDATVLRPPCSERRIPDGQFTCPTQNSHCPKFTGHHELG